MLGVTKEEPELEDSDAADPGNSEQTNPLDTEGSSETQTADSQPEPPVWSEPGGWANGVLVHERSPGESSEGSEADERRVEEDQSGLSNETVLCTPIST